MTIYEIYDQNIKVLPTDEQLRLARLILDVAAPDKPATLIAEAQSHFEALVQDGLDSPAVPLTEGVWNNIRQEVQSRAASRHGLTNA